MNKKNITHNYIHSRNVKDMTSIRESLKDVFVAVLGLEWQELEESETFKNLGVRSVNAVQLLEEINTRFDLNMPTSVVLEFHNLDSLAKYIRENLLEKEEDSVFDLQVTHSSGEDSLEEKHNQHSLDNIRVWENQELTKIRETLKDVFVTVLGLERQELDEAETFQDMGIRSINAVQLMEEINTRFDLNMPTSVMFEFHNLHSLANYIRQSELCTLGDQRADSSEIDSFKENHDHGDYPVDKEKREYIDGNIRIKDDDTCKDIAIIGLSCRCAGADGQHKFWSLLSRGKDCIHQVQTQSWLDFVKSNSPSEVPLRYGVMDGIEYFDPLFFRISPKEAEAMDVTHRILLEECYKAVEDSGYAPSSLRGQQVGTFIGSVGGNPVTQDLSRFSMLGFDTSILAGRIAYFLDLKGPAMAINTACSSSLVAIDTACQKLKNQEIDMAIAGGITVYSHPGAFIAMNNAGMLSPTGECRPFDNEANGIVVGDGVGIVILKRLKEAQCDNDYIYGIIRGSGVNQDGRTSAITVPSFLSQSQLQESVYKRNRITVEDIQYIETHGTATKLGDPIEIHALSDSFGKFTPKKRFCAIGSVKANIGHTTAAAGVLGIIKVLLSMKNKKIPPSINFFRGNEHIDFDNSPVYVNTTLREWPLNSKGSRLAAVSSFGFSGTNAHVVIEEGPGSAQGSEVINESTPGLLLLSAESQEGLRTYARKTREFLQSQDDINLAEMLYTFQVGRESMSYRLALVCSSREMLLTQLEQFIGGQITELEDGYVGKTGKKEGLSIEDTDEGKEFLQKLVQHKQVRKLAQLWANGNQIDWTALSRKGTVKRLSGLPTYPFARERYWTPKVESATNTATPVKTSVHPMLHRNTSNLETETHSVEGDLRRQDTPKERKICFLKKHWELCPVAVNKSANRTMAILTTKETREVATRLSLRFPGSKILDLNDLEAQPQQSVERWKNYDGCVDLVGCGKEKSEALNWMAWLQQLIEHGPQEDLMLLCVTKGLESYQNTEVNLSGASRAGLYRMLQSEYGHLRSRHMDGDPSDNDEAMVQQIASEFLQDSEEPEICYRNGNRYRAFLDEAPEGDNIQGLVFPEDQVLLITGGTRGLGYLCARHFVTNYGVKRLVLTGRENLPPREQWNTCKQQLSSAAQKIRNIQALEAQGAEVLALSLPLTDEHAVQQSLQEITDKMGHIGGIIHCAGFAGSDNPAFIRKSLDEIKPVLDPKVAGLNVLCQSLKNEPLQFFILFSSVSAIIPTLAAGSSDYAMANAYMDYVAEANIRNFPIVSIQWPSWKESGVGEVKSRVYHQTGLLSHTDTEGLGFLDQIIAREIGPVILPAVVNPEILKPYRLMQRRVKEVLVSVQPQRPITINSSQVSDILVKATQTWLIELFSKELKIDTDKLETNVPFQDYGVDSIMLAQIREFISRRVTEDLEPFVLYEYSTIESLAGWLLEKHAFSLGEAFGVSVLERNTPVAQETPDLPLISSVRRALTKGRGRRSRLCKSDSPDIAVIGISCRFPGGNILEDYWQLLSEGKSAIRSVPRERWGYSNNFYAGLLDNITYFDPSFFLIREEDARAMDPQALAVLEESLKLWYQAGYTLQEIKGKSVGVYLGGRSQHRPDETSLHQTRNPIVAVGQNYMAANISHFFDLRGPSLVLDTACSSALVGMNMAFEALHSGEIICALVGGVSLLNTDEPHLILQQRRILSRGQTFHLFDQRASGIVLGEGVGMVLLKTVDQALADGDQIYAVIKAIAVNNDGRTPGPATPSFQAQKEVMQTALKKSGKKPEDISYIETNGLGSEVVDLFELKAIQSVYCSSNIHPLGLGSMKPNIGHPLCAEGIASFIKVVLMLQHRQFVPFLSGEKPMTHFNIESSPFYFSRQLIEWTNTPRIAAINCFADGGTNVHVILEEWVDPNPCSIKRKPIPHPILNRYDVRSAERYLPHKDQQVLKDVLIKQPTPKSIDFWRCS